MGAVQLGVADEDAAEDDSRVEMYMVEALVHVIDGALADGPRSGYALVASAVAGYVKAIARDQGDIARYGDSASHRSCSRANL